MQREFDVALSFAGEDRQHAKELADLLDSGGYEVFYDEYEQAELWGKNLLEYLSTVYKDKARYCVVFLSEFYAEKWWPRLELRSAAARAFKENEEYILPIRLDDTEIEGLLPTVGYLDLREVSIEEVYQALVQKLSGTLQTPVAVATSISTKGVSTNHCCRNCHFLAKYALTDGGQEHKWTWDAKERSDLKVKDHYGVECAKGIWSAGIDPEINSRLEEELLKERNECFFLEYDEANKSMTFDAATELLQFRGEESQQIREATVPLEQASEPRPLSEESAVTSLKRFLAEPRYRIHLADLIDETVERVIEVTSGSDFDANHPRPTTETVTSRIRAYESACTTLIEMAMVGGRWAEKEHCEIWHRALQRFSMVPHRNGKVAWLDMQLYPGMLLLYALGLGAVEADRLAFLGHLFSVVVHRESNERLTVVQVFAPYQRFDGGGAMKMLEGMENHHLPLNEWVFNLLQQSAKGMIPEESRYLYNFVKLEILMTLNSVYRPGSAWRGATRGVFLYHFEISWDILQEMTDSISIHGDESPFVRADIFGQISGVCMQHIDHLKQWISNTAKQLGTPRWQVLQEQADRDRRYMGR